MIMMILATTMMIMIKGARKLISYCCLSQQRDDNLQDNDDDDHADDDLADDDHADADDADADGQGGGG